MSVTIDEIKNIANLSMLHFNDADFKKIVGEMQKIVEFAEKINSFLMSDSDSIQNAKNDENNFDLCRTRMRNDCVSDSTDPKMIFENAKNQKNNFFYLKNSILKS